MDNPGCYSNELVLPNTLKALGNEYMLASTINFPNGIDDELKIPFDGWGCESILVEGVEVFPLTYIEQGYFGFSIDFDDRAVLTNVAKGHMVPEDYEGGAMDRRIYDGDTKVTELVIPSEATSEGGIIYPVKSIGNGAFSFYADLESIVLSEGVETIERWAFFLIYSDSVTVNVPSSVYFIETEAFSDTSIVSFPNGKHEDLEIPEDKWGAKKIIIEGVEWVP